MAKSLIGENDLHTEDVSPQLAIIKKEFVNEEVKEIKQEFLLNGIKSEPSFGEVIKIKKEIVDDQVTNIKQEVSDILVGTVKKEEVLDQTIDIKQEIKTEGVSLISDNVAEDKSVVLSELNLNGISLELSGEVDQKVTITMKINEDKYVYQGYVRDVGHGEIVLTKIGSQDQAFTTGEETSIKLNEENANRIRAWLEYSIFHSADQVKVGDNYPIQNRQQDDVQPSTSSMAEENSPTPVPEPRRRERKYEVDIFPHEIEEMMNKTLNRNMARYYCKRVMTPEEREKQDRNNLAARRSRAIAKIRYIKLMALRAARELENNYSESDEEDTSEKDEKCTSKDDYESDAGDT